jgi:hypothetical protein
MRVLTTVFKARGLTCVAPDLTLHSTDVLVSLHFEPTNALSFVKIAILLQHTNSYIFYSGRFIMFTVITHIYEKKTKGPNLKELFTATGKL